MARWLGQRFQRVAKVGVGLGVGEDRPLSDAPLAQGDVPQQQQRIALSLVAFHTLHGVHGVQGMAYLARLRVGMFQLRFLLFPRARSRGGCSRVSEREAEAGQVAEVVGVLAGLLGQVLGRAEQGLVADAEVRRELTADLVA